MLAESVAASLLADGLSSTLGITSSELYRRISKGEPDVSYQFINIFTEKLISEVESLDGVNRLSESDLEIITEVVNSQANLNDVPKADHILPVLSDGLSTILDNDHSRATLEETVEIAYEQSVTTLIEDVSGTELGDRLLINSVLSTEQSISDIEEELEAISSSPVSTETYRRFRIGGDQIEHPSKILFNEGVGDGSVRYVSRPEVPNSEPPEWTLIIGRQGLGKTRSLAELAECITASEEIEHAIIPKPSFRNPKDIESLVDDGVDGDVLLIWDDLQNLGSDGIEQTLRQTLFRLKDYLGSQGHKLYVVASLQADAVPHLDTFEKETDALWEHFSIIKLQPLEESTIRELVSRVAQQVELELSDEVFEQIVRKITFADPSPLYARSVISRLSSLQAEATLEDINNLDSDAADVWHSLYTDLCQNYPDARFVLWAMSLLRTGAIPPYESTLRRLFVDLFNRERFQFEQAVDRLQEQQWIRRSERPWAAHDEPIYQSHDVQMEAVSEDHNRVVEEYSSLLLDSLEETIPAEDSDWIPHYHCNTGLFFSLEFIEGASEFAESHFERAIELSPLDPVIRMNYGEILVSRGQFERAREQYKIALQVAPKWTELRHSYAHVLDRLNHPIQARQEYETVLEEDPLHHPARVNLAQLLIEMGHASTAKKHLETAIEQGYIDDEVFNNFGVLCMETGEVKRAKQIYEQGLDMNPNSAALRHNLAGLLFKTRQPAAAKEILSPVIEEFDYSDPKLYKQYILILAQLGEEQKARSYLELCESTTQATFSESEKDDLLTPTFPIDEYRDLPDEFGYADYLRDEGFHTAARDIYLDILADGHESVEVYLQLAEISVKLADHDAADEYFNSAMRDTPDDAPLITRYGNFLKHQGEYERALQHFEEGLQEHDHVSMRIDYALCLLEAGKYGKAKDEFTSLIDDTEEDCQELPRVHQNYGNLLMLTDQLNLAAEQFERALELRPDYPQAQVSLGQLLLEENTERAGDLLKSGGWDLLEEGKIDDGLRGLAMATEAHRQNGNFQSVVELCDAVLTRMVGISFPQKYRPAFESARQAALNQLED